MPIPSSSMRGVLSRIGATMASAAALATAQPTTANVNITATTVAAPGFQGVYGSGKYRQYQVAGTYNWTCPANVYWVRARVVGAGGAGVQGGVGGAGGGGGFAMGLCAVTPGVTYTVIVGAGGATAGAAGGTSSFGAFLTATGGLGGATRTGGAGSGGDFQSTGGNGGTGVGAGGGASASQLGDGGNGAGSGGAGGGGGGVGGNHATTAAGASAFGSTSDQTGSPDVVGARSSAAGTTNAINAPLRFPFDGFVGGGGAGSTGGNFGGVGAGSGANTTSNIGGGGGGGGVAGNSSGLGDGAPGGGGGSGPSQFGRGGVGVVVLEY